MRGFTLIELLVVIAIIGLLSTVIAAPITQARKKGRDGKKVADIRQITSALQQYADDNLGNYPTSITNLVPVYLSSLPPFATTTAPTKDRYMYTVYGTTDSRYVGFHLGSKLEAANLALSDDRDCYGAGAIDSAHQYCIDSSLDPTNTIHGTTTNFYIGSETVASDFSVPGVTDYDGVATGWVGHLSDGSAGAGDFAGGSDAGNTACVAALQASSTACIYDITN